MQRQAALHLSDFARLIAKYHNNKELCGDFFFFQCHLASVIFLGEQSNQCVDFYWPVNFMGPVPRVFYSIL